MSYITKHEMEQRAREKGARAARKGKKPKDNPFMEKTIYHMFWRDAWDDEYARLHRKDKK